MVMTGQAAVRDQMMERMREDLVGPIEDVESLSERPSDRYLTAILYPPGEAVPSDEDDSIREETGQPEADGDSGEVPIYRSTRPATFGLSFRIRALRPELHLRVGGARYEAETVPSSEVEKPDAPPLVAANDAETKASATTTSETRWRRMPVEAVVTVVVVPGLTAYRLDTHPLDLRCSIRAVRLEADVWGLTAVVSNESAAAGEGPVWTEEHALFQAAGSARARHVRSQ